MATPQNTVLTQVALNGKEVDAYANGNKQLVSGTKAAYPTTLAYALIKELHPVVAPLGTAH